MKYETNIPYKKDLKTIKKLLKDSGIDKKYYYFDIDDKKMYAFLIFQKRFKDRILYILDKNNITYSKPRRIG